MEGAPIADPDAGQGSYRIIAADWVLPVERPPLREAGVVIEGDRIVAVSPLFHLTSAFRGVPVEYFDGCIMTPGLVNAHTHLTLSALAGLIPPSPFEEWLPRLVTALRPWEIADHEASGIVGAIESLSSGVTVVGDIAYGAAEVTRAVALGLGGVFYWELLGMVAEQIGEHLVYLRYPDQLDAFGSRAVCGLSPHSPYTSGPGLLRAVHELAENGGVPTAIHLSESSAEVELLRDGTGPLAGTASRTAPDFRAPGTTTAVYLDYLGVLEGTTAVHACHLASEDVGLVARAVRGVVTCPRSNRYLGNPVPEVAPLLKAGIAVGIGTDSSASNDDLDLMREVRTLSAEQPELDPETLLRMATLGGAMAIGVSERFGALTPGRFADLALFAIRSDDDPARAWLESAGRGSAEAVMSSGAWRVRDGNALADEPAAVNRAALARNRSIRALAGD